MRNPIADLKIELRAVAALIPYIRNAKQHSDAQVAQIEPASSSLAGVRQFWSMARTM